MSEPAAIKATWATYKPVPTRNVLQLTLEVPLEQQADVFKKLGYPTPGSETWVGVALLRSSTDKPAPSSPEGREKGKKSWAELSRAQQAGILCSDPEFQRWAGVDTVTGAAEYVRTVCQVHSRADLDMPPAYRLWDSLVSEFRQMAGREPEMRS